MTKLAINDKKYRSKNIRVTQYYKEDYIYINNFKTRFLVFCIISACIALEVLLKIEKGINVPTTPEAVFNEYIIPYGGFLVGILIVYTLISTIVYNKQYHLAQKHMQEYDKLLKQLEKHESDKLI